MNTRGHRSAIGSCCAIAALLLASMRADARSAGAETKPALEDIESARSTLFDADMVRLEVDEHDAFILKPAKPKADGDKPWVWYAPTLLAAREEDWMSPGARHAWIFKRLLAGGVYVAGVDVGESYGSPAGRAVYDRFYERLVTRYEFSPKPGLLPISRGGLMAYNWAANRPDCVSCIGGIYPLCNLAAYPPLERIAKPYGLTVDKLRAQIDQHNPIARLRPLAAAGVPILHVHGDRDKVVPLESHSAELARRYKTLGGTAEVIVIPGKGHEVVPEYWQEPRLVEFFLKHLAAR